MGYKAIIRFW